MFNGGALGIVAWRRTSAGRTLYRNVGAQPRPGRAAGASAPPPPPSGGPLRAGTRITVSWARIPTKTSRA